MLRYRLLTGALLIAGLLGLVWLDHRLDPWWVESGADASLPRGAIMILTILAILPLAAGECTRVIVATGVSARTWLTGISALAGFLAFVSGTVIADATTAVSILATAAGATFFLALVTFTRGQNVHGVLPAAGAVLLVFVYLGVLPGFLIALRQSHSAWLIVTVILMTKSCDIGAYFTGRAIGRHRLIPWLSPGKTREGLAGGMILAALTGICLLSLAGPAVVGREIPLWFGAACGAILGAVGQLGDLIMSLFKRGAGIKDSSHILPGMGGVMDVLDSPLLVAPVAFWIFVAGVPALLGPG